MLRQLLASILLLCTLQMSSQVSVLRDYYFKAGAKEGISAFYNYTKNITPANAVELAYKGVAEAMYAEVVKGVGDKFAYFDRGKALIEQAIAQDVYNPEIRFLRFSVQAEVPMIVGYRDKIAEDGWKVIGALKTNMMNPKDDFWKKAIRFMLDSGELDNNQTRELAPYAT